MSAKITKAMILAAGRGSRMRELTNETPKPLIKVAGRSLIDRIADKIAAFGIKDCVVNVCYLGDKIKADLKARSDIRFTFSEEETALETGGGVKKALGLLDDEFFVINADPIWTEPNEAALTKMANSWDSSTTDILLLLVPMTNVFGHDGTGDYVIDEKGIPHRKMSGTTAPYVYAGVQILHKRIFDMAPEGKFSLNLLYDIAEKAGRLKAVILDGNWYHVGTPEAMTLAENDLSQRI